MAVLYGVVLFALIVSQIEFYVNGEDECRALNVFIYNADDKNWINGWRYTDGEYSESENVAIKTNVSKVRSLAFDFQHNELLLIDDEKPDTVWSVSHTVDIHPVLYKKDANFQSIAVDPITNNFYYADSTRGIGVCSRRNSNFSCTLLVQKPDNAVTVYHDLTIYYQRGLLFWIEKQVGQKSKLRRAGMNGQNIRSSGLFDTAKSIALDAQHDKLYVLLNNDKVESFMIHNHLTSDVHSFSYKPTMIYSYNCDIFGHELDEPANSNDDLDMKFPKEIRFVVLDYDRLTEPNPCQKFTCNGVCVLAEGHPEPIESCAPITSNPGTATIEVESIEEGVSGKLCSNGDSMIGFFIFTTIVLAVILVAYVALNVSPSLRLEMRYRIPYLSNFKFFDGPRQCGGDSNTLSNI